LRWACAIYISPYIQLRLAGYDDCLFHFLSPRTPVENITVFKHRHIISLNFKECQRASARTIEDFRRSMLLLRKWVNLVRARRRRRGAAVAGCAQRRASLTGEGAPPPPPPAPPPAPPAARNAFLRVTLRCAADAARPRSGVYLNNSTPSSRVDIPETLSGLPAAVFLLARALALFSRARAATH
jgi:hypothetical protein